MLCEMLNLRERHDATKDECQARYIGVERIFSKYVEEVVNESPEACIRIKPVRQHHARPNAASPPKSLSGIRKSIAKNKACPYKDREVPKDNTDTKGRSPSLQLKKPSKNSR